MVMKIKEIASIIFNIPINDIPDDASIGSIVQWDSKNHLNFMLSLEEEFNLTFTEQQLSELTDLERIQNYILKKSN